MKNGKNLDQNNWRGNFAEFISCGGSPLCKTFQPRIVMIQNDNDDDGGSNDLGVDDD